MYTLHESDWYVICACTFKNSAILRKYGLLPYSIITVHLLDREEYGVATE